MEKSVEAYTAERLQQGLDFAVKSLQRRDISSRSAIIVQNYREQVSDTLAASADKDRVALIGGVRVLEGVFQTVRFLSTDPSASVMLLQKEILRLREMEYSVRYGDYLAKIPNEVKRFVKASDIKDNIQLLSDHSWTHISKLLSEDPDTETDRKKKTALISLITETCSRLGLDYKLVMFSMVEYGKRNSIVHRNLDEMKSAAGYFILGQVLCEDLRDVDLVFSVVRSKVDNEYLRSIIKAEIDMCFDTTTEGYDNHRFWRPTKYLHSCIDMSKAQQISPPFFVISERMEMILDELDSGASETRKQKKRVASSEEACGGERATNKRLDLVGSRAKVSEAIQWVGEGIARLDDLKREPATKKRFGLVRSRAKISEAIQEVEKEIVGLDGLKEMFKKLQDRLLDIDNAISRHDRHVEREKGLDPSPKINQKRKPKRKSDSPEFSAPATSAELERSKIHIFDLLLLLSLFRNRFLQSGVGCHRSSTFCFFFFFSLGSFTPHRQFQLTTSPALPVLSDRLFPHQLS